ncbi:hypothetical protein OC25_08750 [Pedobacter kyungheensis]|uniref:Uncharacterized protein n=1 Tax=Pedobacter kyungheensis TaxID=1069985 RepID=A0A0C1FP74_9SPHI|nr:SIR2 family protein [Pedobacter kyungheensis]KIA94742.1 hypothetical protein OC25_08750 [Pedobacter kyungheensis]
MKKINASININDKKYSSYLKNNAWTLCLGAGICQGILPNWFELTRRVINSTFKYNWDAFTFKTITESIPFSLDGWLQACQNHLVSNGSTIEDFYSILEQSLYYELVEKAKVKKLEKELKIFLNNPKRLTKSQLLPLCDFFDSEYQRTTILQLKDILLNKDRRITRPAEIITFNADPLLSSLLIIYAVKLGYEETGIYNFQYEEYIKVTRPFETGVKKIPIYHLHGSIAPPQLDSFLSKKEARDNLVFAEGAYTKIAGTMLSWAQNMFLHFAINRKMVFLGLSMSDPNIRRWLSWTTENMKAQLEIYTKSNPDFTKHLWITRINKNSELNVVLEASLKHMSVKPGWINNWNELELGLLNLMGKH